MAFWTHLGIEQTKDTEAIQAAYHQKLPLVNPEDKPEEFKALRAEYEEALRYAAQQEPEEKPESELTPVERWTKRLDDIYMHIADRCDAEKWKALLSDPLFESLDSRADAFHALMVYLMEHWHLPQEIWQLLDSTFELKERREELLEKYPKDFVDNALIGGPVTDSHLTYELFLPQNTGDVDPFFPLYFKARDEIFGGDFDNAKATLADIDATGILHPYAEVLRLRYDYMRAGGDTVPDEVLVGAKALYEQYPGSGEIAGFYADMLSNAGENEAAVGLYDKILEADPDNHNMRYHKAQALMELGDYKAAKDLFCDLYEALPYNNTIKNGFDAANQKLTEQYAQELAEDPGNFKKRMEYAWCLLQNDEAEKTKEIMNIPAPEDLAQRCDYENILTKLCQHSDDYEGALQHAAIWRSFVEQLPEGETEEEKRRKNKQGDIALVESAALLNLQRPDEALQKSDEAIAADPKEYRAYHIRYLACVALHDYDEAVKSCEEMVRIKPSAVAYYLLGRAQYHQGNMQDSFHSFGEALEYDKDASSYICRARILIMYDEYDDAQEIIDMLKQHEIHTEGVKYCESLILSEKEDKEDEAKALWQEIIDADEKDECDCEFLWEVYTDMVVYMLRHDADPNEILAMIERGLKARDDYSPLLMNKGYVLDEKLDRHEEGLAVYRKVYEAYPRHTSVCEKMGGIYYFDLHDIPAALSFYTQQSERADNPFCQLMLGNCYSMLEKYDESEAHFKAALALDSESERALRDYAIMLLRCRRYDDALATARKLDGIVGDRSPYAKRIVARVLARMGKYAEAAAILIGLYEKFDSIRDIDAAGELLIGGGIIDTFLPLMQQYKKKLGDSYYIHMINYYMSVGNDRRWLNSVHSLSLGNTERLRYLARYHYLHGKYKNALSLINTFYSAEPDSIMDRYMPIDCLRRLGRGTDQFDALYERGLQVLAPDNTPDYQPLYLTKKAEMLIALERFEEAKACIDKAFASPLCEHCKYGGCIDGYMALALYYEAIGDFNSAARACLEGQKISPCDFAVILRRLRKEHKKELDKELQK